MGRSKDRPSESAGFSRRGFMRIAGLGTAVAGAAVVAAAGAPDTASAAEGAYAPSAGYAETDHVKTYYALARL